MTLPEVDVVIIGSGAGGAASAWALSKQGIKVIVLEAGPAYDPYTDYRLHSEQWEQSMFPEKATSNNRYSFGEMQKLEPARSGLLSWNHISGKINSTGKRYGWKYHHVRGVGGSTLHFTGEAHRVRPESMKMYSRFGVAADWPLDYAELEPYYLKAEQLVGVAGQSDDPVRFRGGPYPLPPHAPGYASKKIIGETKKLGLNWQPNSLAVLSQPRDSRPACNYCANCNRGCPRKDKGSADVTYMQQALATGYCTLLTQSQVLRINAGGNSRISSIDFVDQKGKAQSINTRMLIVSCGAIETPRLLLLSENKYAPDGLANETGHVGKHFMETLAWTSAGIHNEALGSHRGLPADIICWDYNAPDAIPGVIGGCRFTPSTAESDLVGPVNYAKRVVSGWGRGHKNKMRKTFGNVLAIGAIGESLPTKRSFIGLDSVKTDNQGRPVEQIHSWLKESEIKRLEFMASKAREILLSSGVGKIIEEFGSYDLFSSTHVFGTARMGDLPDSSVVNRWCRAHHWKNLFIVDGSVFPSSGGGESPSLTINALAIRTAVHIRALISRKDI